MTEVLLQLNQLNSYSKLSLMNIDPELCLIATSHEALTEDPLGLFWEDTTLPVNAKTHTQKNKFSSITW